MKALKAKREMAFHGSNPSLEANSTLGVESGFPFNGNWRLLYRFYKSYKLVQGLRIMVENTERNYKRDWKKDIDELSFDPMLLVWKLKDELKKRWFEGPAGKEENEWSEAYWANIMKKALKNNRTYMEYLRFQYGFKTAPISASGLLGMIGKPSNYKGLRSLWHYAGLHVNEKTGEAPKFSDYKKGQKRDYNHLLRALLSENIGKTLIKKASPYRSKYEKYRKQEDDKHDWETCRSCQQIWRKSKKNTSKLHCFNRAKRKVVKDFLKNLWRYWNPP